MRRAKATTISRRSPSQSGDRLARLVILDGPGRGRKFKIGKEVVIGRSSTCEVLVDDSEVSRRHARVCAVGDGFEVADLGSHNGTAVNGVPVERATLSFGDKITLSQKVTLVLARYDSTEEELLQRQRLETLGRLATGLAHDFNNMQSVITAGLDFVLRQSGGHALAEGRMRDAVEDALRASERASELARSLMVYARADDEGHVNVDLSHICEEVLRFSQRTFESAITIRADVQPGLRTVGSSAELHQMLMNLCVNARDAMADGGTMVLCAYKQGTETHASGPPGVTEQVIITVSDTGVGMDERTREQIFEPFFTTKSARAGFGLGLASVQQIVTAHGGEILVESQSGEGTTFRVRLPAAASAGSRRADSVVPPAVILFPAGTRVLVADDESMVRRSVRRILEQAGCEVVEAADGVEVVSHYKAERRRPDVVLLDLDMPKSPGEQAIQSLRYYDPEVRILAVSGQDERKGRAYAAGANAFLPKPFSAGKLVHALYELLSGSITGELTHTDIHNLKP